MSGPLVTLEVDEILKSGSGNVECSLDLGRTRTTVEADAAGWTWQGRRFPFLEKPRDRTIYWWDGEAFRTAQRYSGALIKLVPTKWGTPTFEIDGVKMLVTENLSPWEDAARKVATIEPRDKRILDCCGGMGYFVAQCLAQGAREVRSYEKSEDVIWLRSLNPWSPDQAPIHGDIAREILRLPDASFDAVLHDPPRFGIAGELYSQAFYDQLARVLRRRGRLFHYTGAPNKLTSGRDVPAEVMKRLRNAGFEPRAQGDGILAVKK